MANFSPSLRHLTHELPADRRAIVEQAIASSPYLRQIMTEAANAGTLEHIRMGVPGANEGGHYDDQKRAIYLSPDTFSDPILTNRPEKLLDAVTSTLGHETGHALNAQKTRNTLAFVTTAITDQIRAAEGGKVDMTPLMSVFLRSARSDEASAEIHGWNALASRIEYTKGMPSSREEILKRANPSTDCVDGPPKHPKLAPGILLDSDMQMSDTRLPKTGPINLEPVAKCHFDNPRASLGAGGAADYPNYYAAYLIQQIADDTKFQTYPARIEIDMAKLGLDKAQLESTGLRLGDGGFFFSDISKGGHTPVVLRSAGSGIQGTPDDIIVERAANSYGASTVAMPTTAPVPRSDPRDPDHPDHRLYRQIEAGVRQIDAEQGRTFDQNSERLTLRTLAEAKAAGIVSADHIAINNAGKPQQDGTHIAAGTLLFVVQGRDASDPAARRSMTDVAQAIAQPTEQSLQALNAMNPQQSLGMTPQPNQPGQDQTGLGPRVR